MTGIEKAKNFVNFKVFIKTITNRAGFKKKVLTRNYFLINYLLNGTITMISALKVSYEFGLEINIGFMRLWFQLGG